MRVVNRLFASTLAILIVSCAGLDLAKQAAESVIEKEARESVAPDLLLVRETIKATSFRMDLLTGKLETIASEFSTFNASMRHLGKEVNKYIVDADKRHDETSRRLSLLEKKTGVDTK